MADDSRRHLDSLKCRITNQSSYLAQISPLSNNVYGDDDDDDDDDFELAWIKYLTLNSIDHFTDTGTPTVNAVCTDDYVHANFWFADSGVFSCCVHILYFASQVNWNSWNKWVKQNVHDMQCSSLPKW